ncbi:MAG TPA: peptidoglycan DD-metalloendopeptidase family protein [Herpetosiphonaceae bacterium]
MIGRSLCLLLIGLALVACAAASGREERASAPAASATPAPTLSSTAAPSATATPAPTLSPTAAPSATATPAPPAPTATITPTIAAQWSYPIGQPGHAPGDGFFIRHGYNVENTWYNPGYWHTGEDWYAVEGDTAGATVYAVADGDVVYAGSNYPGRVVIVKHADDRFSMYGHLDPALAIEQGQHVIRGARLGTVLRRSDDVPNHLHFEIRTFLTSAGINGDRPRYGFRCGPQCPPGPGYWPIAAPDLPNAQGWRNPTHVIARRAFPAEPAGALGEVVVATPPASPGVTLWAQLAEDATPQQPIADVALQPGERFALLAVRAGPEAPQATGADSYRLWYRVRLPDGREGWAQAAVPSDFETGSDGRAATIRFNFYPVSASDVAAQDRDGRIGLHAVRAQAGGQHDRLAEP